MNLIKTAALATVMFALTGCLASTIEDAIEAEAEATARERAVAAGVDAGLNLEKSLTTTVPSGGDDDDSDDTSSSDDDITFDLSDFEDYYDDDELGDAFVARAEDLYGGIIDLLDTPYTDPSTLPTVGGATYTGLLSLGPAIGDLTLTADFKDNAIGGSVDNVLFSDDTTATGSLAITSAPGSLDRSADTRIDFTFTADLDGTLTDPDDSYLIDATLEGDFTGTNHGYIEGLVEGTVTENGSGNMDFLFGDFVGER